MSLADPTSACDTDPSDTVAPQIIQKKSGTEGAQRAEITANGGTTTIYFNGLGRPVNPGGVATITQIDIANSSGGICQHVDPANGAMRCLRITISTGGSPRCVIRQ